MKRLTEKFKLESNSEKQQRGIADTFDGVRELVLSSVSSSEESQPITDPDLQEPVSIQKKKLDESILA